MRSSFILSFLLLVCRMSFLVGARRTCRGVAAIVGLPSTTRGTTAFVHGFTTRRVWSEPTLRRQLPVKPPSCLVSESSSSSQTRLFASASSDQKNDNNNNKPDNDDDDWTVPKYITIPQHQLEFSFVRSSGAGGQNVNKVNSQVQIRFHVMTAGWLPYEVRQRLQQQQASKINQQGYLFIASQEFRTQTANRQAALQKLQAMILTAWPRPAVRQMRTGLSARTKEQRKQDKRRRSLVKESRRRVDF